MCSDRIIQNVESRNRTASNQALRQPGIMQPLVESPPQQNNNLVVFYIDNEPDKTKHRFFSGVFDEKSENAQLQERVKLIIDEKEIGRAYNELTNDNKSTASSDRQRIVFVLTRNFTHNLSFPCELLMLRDTIRNNIPHRRPLIFLLDPTFDEEGTTEHKIRTARNVIQINNARGHETPEEELGQMRLYTQNILELVKFDGCYHVLKMQEVIDELLKYSTVEKITIVYIDDNIKCRDFFHKNKNERINRYHHNYKIDTYSYGEPFTDREETINNVKKLIEEIANDNNGIPKHELVVVCNYHTHGNFVIEMFRDIRSYAQQKNTGNMIRLLLTTNDQNPQENIVELAKVIDGYYPYDQNGSTHTLFDAIFSPYHF